jgi:hypothetical protein
LQKQKNILILKLDEFIRKYYKNQLLKGTIYSGGILLAAFLTVVTLEYFAEFNNLIRAVLFFGYLAAASYVIIRFVVLPLLKINRIGPVISYKEAAAIIGNHFSNVQDKLINVLQLQEDKLLGGSEDLLLAGINQKIEELNPVRFTTAVDLSGNKKYLRFILPLFFITASMLLIWPQVISKSTIRLVNYDTYYEKEMPFKFNILNKNLQALQTEDFRLDLKITGAQVPDEVFIEINGISYKLDKKDKINFVYTFSNLQGTVDFQFSASGYLSKAYTLEVLPKPTLLNFRLHLDYPGYINRASEDIDNSGDMQIPQGTKVNWVFNTSNTDSLSLVFSDSSAFTKRINDNQFRYSRKFLKSDIYTVKASNRFVPFAADSVSFSVQVIQDQFPTINVEAKPDSLNSKNIYYSGLLKDDYGFSGLRFHWKKIITDTNGKVVESDGSTGINLAKRDVSQQFFYFFDASLFDLQAGDKVEYYFEVFDNDGVNGPKSSKSQLLEFKAPSRDEIIQSTEKNNSEIKKDLEESIKKAKQLQKDVSDLARKINDKKQPGYEEKKKLEELLKKQAELQNKINQIKQENELNNKQQNEYSKTDESILEKQKQLEQLFENVMSPEMKKLFDELNKMMDKLDKNMIQEKLEELKLSNKDIEKELDRNLEAFKQLEVAQKMQNVLDKLDELKKKEQGLREETIGKEKKEENNQSKQNQGKDKENDKKDKDEKTTSKTEAKDLEKKQEEINKEFEDLKKELKDLEQKNKELEEPNTLPDTEKKQKEISDQLQKSSEQLSKNNKKSASESQKNAAQKMEEMAEELENSMLEEEEKQESENAQAIRQILENLLNLSFAQEELMIDLDKTRIDNPKYVDIPKQQNKLKDDSKIIEDSLLALSKRAPQISAIVNREISAIHLNMGRTVKQLAERNSDQSKMYMQGTMKSVNDLAALLNESLEEMQKQMKARMQSKSQKGGKCKKPGTASGKNPASDGNPVSNMRKMQEQLNKQLKDLKEALEKGQKPGDKPGDKQGKPPGQGQGNSMSGNNLPGSSEQFAKMAAQQKALRLQMEQLMEKLKNKGKNPGGDMASLMEETEKELVNKQLSSETMRRQQDILNRLLESEKAEREREQDEQRKSNEAKNEIYSNPSQFLEYKRLKEREIELLNTVPPGLTPYYKEKVNNYFNNLNK